MANKHGTLSELFTNIANAIRSKTGSTQEIIADNFPTEISNLRTGFDYNNQSATTISDYEFYNCTDLKSVDCYNLTSVGTSAFENCSNLKSVILYDGVESVDENAFKGCNEDLVIFYKGSSAPESWHENWNPDNCTVIFGDLVETWNISATENDSVTAYLCAINNNDYTLYVYGNGNVDDYDSASQVPWVSYRNNIVEIIMNDNVTSIGNRVFYKCTSLTSITIPDSVTSIGRFAFCDCNRLTSVTIGGSVTSIGFSAFNGCSSLTSITLPDSVTSIGERAFEYCYKLTSINIPDSVTNIGAYAFSETNLTSITYTGTVAKWNAINFNAVWAFDTPNYTIHCTDGDIAKDGTITYHTTSGGEN